MKKILVLALVSLFILPALTFSKELRRIGTTQTIAVTSTSTAVTCNVSIPEETLLVRLNFDGDTMKLRGDGTAPVSNSGETWNAGDVWYATPDECRNLKAILGTGGTGATIFATPMGYR